MSRCVLLALSVLAFSCLDAHGSETAPAPVVRTSQMARHLVSVQKSQEAIELLTRVLRRFPDSAELLVRRGQIRTYVEQNDAACDDFKLALQSANLNPFQCSVMIAILIELDHHDLALKVYTKGKGLSGSNLQRSTFLYQSGCLLRRSNRRPEAIVLLKEAARLRPTNLDCCEELILVYADLHNWDQVISTANSFEKANKVVEKRSGLARIYDRRASAYMYKKQYREAIADISKAIAISPLTVAFVRKRAECYGKLGDRLAQKRDEERADEIVKSFVEK